MGEQPNPWNILQPQVAKSQHRGAKPSRRCELLGKIRNLCTPPLPFGRPTPHRNCLPETVPWPIVRIFTDMSISPSFSPRQCPDHYSFHAGQNLPDKEFHYLRTVIVTAAVHRGFGRQLPSLGMHQPPYMVLRLCGDLCFCLLHPSGPTRGSTRIFTCCPSTTPFGLILGLDSPSVDEPCRGTLRSLSSIHLRRKSARSVSYYALFQGWLLLGKPPGCLCTPTSFITKRSFRGLSW
ncbi:hypothetical protein BT93_F2281 [Corymbia citriodora subsp. variegata]|nr:hypothetical protein BT93_F2281 [Corymbia citriodora subsp. variegata]